MRNNGLENWYLSARQGRKEQDGNKKEIFSHSGQTLVAEYHCIGADQGE